jgi:hypothetical protein
MSQKTGLVLCLHLTDSMAELYSPLQSQEAIPASTWSLRGDTLRMECKSIGFKTVLARHGDGWQGYWKQGIMKEDISFAAADTLFQLRRPQTPVAPYRFAEETVTLTGKLVELPNGSERLYHEFEKGDAEYDTYWTEVFYVPATNNQP